MTKHFDSAAELVPGPVTGPFKTAQAQKSLSRQMDQTRRNAAPTITGQQPGTDATAYDRSAPNAGDHIMPEGVIQRIIPPPREVSRKRQRPGLTPGMRARLLGMISRARSARAAAEAHLARRHELIPDLVTAQQRHRQLTDAFERTMWARSGSSDHADATGEVAQQLQRVERLKAEIARLDQEASDANERSAGLRAMIQSIGKGLGVGKNIAIWGDYDLPDLDLLEEKLING